MESNDGALGQRVKSRVREKSSENNFEARLAATKSLLLVDLNASLYVSLRL